MGEQLLISGYSVAKVSLLQKTQKNKCHKMNKEKTKGGGLSEKLCLPGAGARNCWTFIRILPMRSGLMVEARGIVFLLLL